MPHDVPVALAGAVTWYIKVLHAAGKAVTFDEFIKLVSDLNESPRATRERIRRLEQLELVHVTGRGQHTALELTDKGRHQLNLLKLLEIEVPDQWDSQWRMVIFDIPEVNREARYQIRRLLVELGFVQLQQSVWLHPLDCLEQFRKLQTAYGIEHHLHLLEVVGFDAPASIISKFRKKYPKLNLK